MINNSFIKLGAPKVSNDAVFCIICEKCFGTKGLWRNHKDAVDRYWLIVWLIDFKVCFQNDKCSVTVLDTEIFFLLVLQLQNLNLMPYDYIPPVDIKTEPYIPETGTKCHTERLKYCPCTLGRFVTQLIISFKWSSLTFVIFDQISRQFHFVTQYLKLSLCWTLKHETFQNLLLESKN